MTLFFLQCPIPCNTTKQMCVYHCQVKYPVVEINVFNLLLSAVLKNVVAARLVIDLPSVGCDDAVTIFVEFY